MSSSSPKERPLVSIVTPSYNQGKFIEKTILSVIGQDYENLEYIVVDAVSKDETASILDKHRSRISRIICEKDRGQADAINKGFKLTTGSIMAYLNSDDCYASPHIVRKVVQLFEENPAVDVIYGKREFVNEGGSFHMNYPYRPFDKMALLQACYIPQECVFWRRDIYVKAGDKVDETFNFAMDYDLWLRFIEAGANWLSVDEVFGLFRWYDDQKSQLNWQNLGLPEIARLQTKYLGKPLSTEDMIAAHEKHFMRGADPHSSPKVWKIAQRHWERYLHMKRQTLGGYPLDAWVYHPDFARV